MTAAEMHLARCYRLRAEAFREEANYYATREDGRRLHNADMAAHCERMALNLLDHAAHLEQTEETEA